MAARTAPLQRLETSRPADRQRGLGIALLVISATLFSSAGLFTKGVAADAWSILFWRGLAAAAGTLAYIALRGQLLSEWRRMGRAGWAVAVIGAIGSAAYIPALKITSIANVTLIYAAVPLLAAAFAWVSIGERPSRRVGLCCLLAFLGVLVIVQGSLGQVVLTGDLLALVMTASLAAIMVIYRCYPETPAALPAVFMSLFLLPPALLLTDPVAATGGEIGLMAAFGLVFALAAVTLAEGARRIAAAEAGLLSALETPLAPLWAWLLLAELPPQATWIGGSLVMAAVLWAQLPNRRRD
ncbi:MAG: DMT family transporter [Pseudomonadota bacterium]